MMHYSSPIQRMVLFVLILVLFVNGTTWVQAAPKPKDTVRTATATTPRIPVYFIANRGQMKEQVAYYAQGQRYAFYFTAEALVMRLDQALLSTHFSGAKTVIPIGKRPTRARVNDFTGDDPARWRASVPTYGEVVYPSLYPGIDLHYTGQDGGLKYTFTLQPGADPAQIRLALEGNDGLILDADGNLRIQVAGRVLQDERPTAYQWIEGRRVDVPISFVIYTPHSYGFRLPAGYDAHYPLIIDPSLDYASFLGGSESENIVDIAVDDEGYVYVTGSTRSTDFPTTPGAYAPTHAGGTCGDPFMGYYPCDDAFVLKLDPRQSGADALVYSTFLGGSDVDHGSAIALDSAGHVYVKGSTFSTDFPTVNAYQAQCSNDCQNRKGDFFLAKLSPAGDSLLYATYLGGSEAAASYDGLAADDAGRAYITGYTSSSDFPTSPGAWQPNFAGENWDGIVAGFDTTQAGAASLLYASYLGGSGDEIVNDLTLDAEGNLYLGGYTDSPDLPITPGAFQPAIVSVQDNFVIKLRPDGSAPIYATYIGGSSYYDRMHGMAMNAAGEVCVTGDTKSTDWPVTDNAHRPDYEGSFEAYLTCLNATGTGLTYSTYLGGSKADYAYDVVMGADGQAYITGYTSSQDFPTADPIQPAHAGGTDAFISQFDLATGALRFSTYLGGSDADWNEGDYWDVSWAIAQDAEGYLYIAGFTTSDDFPVTDDAYQSAIAGEEQDALIAKLDPRPSVYTIAGRVHDATGDGLDGIRLTTGTPYSTTTDAGGYYTLTIPTGVYSVTPATMGYFWDPPSRVIHVPPKAADQNFLGQHIIKANTPGPTVVLDDGDRITYTVKMNLPYSEVKTFYDQTPTRTTYVSGSLQGPEGLAYRPTMHAISGPLSLTAGAPSTVSFAVHVIISDTNVIAIPITNRACIAPHGRGLNDCLWSNSVKNYMYLWRLYLPLVVKTMEM